MAEQINGIKHDMGELDVFELFGKARSIMAEYKYWVFISPVLFFLLGFVASKIVSPQWEASINTFVIARVCDGDMALPCSSCEMPELVASLLERSASSGFQDAVLKNYAGEFGKRDTALYKKTQSVRLKHEPNLIEIKVRAYSRATAVSLASATAEEFKRVNIAMSAPRLNSLKEQLARAKNTIAGINASLVGSRQVSSGVDALSKVVAMYLTVELESKVLAIQTQLDLVDKKPAFFSEAKAEILPVYPKPLVWAVCSGLFGIFLAAGIPLALSFFKSLNA